jgi:hypothetical protein
MASTGIASIALLVGYATPGKAESWYYCNSAHGYYPYVSVCPEPWREVPPNWAERAAPDSHPSQAGEGWAAPRPEETSFDCAQAHKLAERLICSTPELAALDRQLADLFVAVRNQNLGAAIAANLQGDEARWLTAERNACSDVACLRQAYQSRITALRAQGQGSDATPLAPVSDAFRQGQIDRQRWDAWFSSQTGDVQVGADYWAAHRSPSDGGSCAAADHPGVSPEWLAGCLEAKRQLAVIDARRKGAPEYRRGFNTPLLAQAAPTVQATPIIQVAPTVQAVPTVPDTLTVQANPIVKSESTGRNVPIVDGGGGISIWKIIAAVCLLYFISELIKHNRSKKGSSLFHMGSWSSSLPAIR